MVTLLSIFFGGFMRLFLAIFFPPILFFTIGRPGLGILNFFLMITIIGWIPAAIWAVYALSEHNQKQRFKELARMQAQQAQAQAKNNNPFDAKDADVFEGSGRIIN